MIESEKYQKEFVSGYTTILRALNNLTIYEDFVNNAATLDPITEQMHILYRGKYLEIYEKLRDKNKVHKVNIIDDIEFEMELIKKVNIDVDYILELIKKLKDKNQENKIIEAEIYNLIDSDPRMRSKKKLIQEFIETYNAQHDTELTWAEFIKKKKKEDFNKLINDYKLDESKTNLFLNKCFKQGYVDAERDSMDITGLMKAKINLLMGDEYIKKQKQIVVDAINEYFETYNEL